MTTTGHRDRAELDDDLDGHVAAIVDQLSLAERLHLMSGDGAFVRETLSMAKRYNGEPIVAGQLPERGLPGIRFTDGPRGVVMYSSTAFPVPMARGATFDPTLEERIGDAIGVEARTQGANLFAGVCINLLRHPAWGRAQETYGEDSHLLGEMGAALVRGVGRHVLSCVKHFAVNSMENSRLWVDVEADERDLRDIYLPHFRRCLDEGAEAVMSAYNGVNGDRCGHSRWLLTDVLKDEWGFDGFVMSDFTFGISSASKAANAGMDLEMPYRALFAGLKPLVRMGRIPGSRVRDAATRLVRAQLRAARKGTPERYRPEVVAGAEHRALAREAAARSLVLLRNEPVHLASDAARVLPIDPATVRSIAVVGSLAAADNLGDLGSSQVHPPEVVTLLDGLVAAGDRHEVEVRYTAGRDGAELAEVVGACDVAVVVVGHTFRDEGEWIIRAGGDRSSLRLRPDDESLIGQVARCCPRTVVLLMGGSAIVTDRWQHLVPALAMVWYPGMEGGHGVADVVFGEVEPQGRLPLTWPSSDTTLPPFDRFCRRTTYGPLHGYRLMEASDQTPSFPFGFGLGYAHATWSTPTLVAAAPGATSVTRAVTVSVDLTAGDDRAAVAVVQVYVPEVLGSHLEPLRTLRGVQRVEVAAGTTVTVNVTCAVPLDASKVYVGASSDPNDLVEVPLA